MAKTPSQPTFFSWLGRQIGHVQKAVQTDPVAPESKPASPSPQVIYRNDHVEEKEMPDQPGVKLRRTVIDEVIVKHAPKLESESPAPSSKPSST